MKDIQDKKDDLLKDAQELIEDGAEYVYDKAHGMAWEMMSEDQKKQYNLIKAFIEDPESAALQEIEKLLDDEQKLKF
jgi:vacuolar-type H+-ATPase subunit H